MIVFSVAAFAVAPAGPRWRAPRGASRYFLRFNDRTSRAFTPSTTRPRSLPLTRKAGCACTSMQRATPMPWLTISGCYYGNERY